MNVFCSFTRRSLREKRSRTLVTIIGIILSMSLFTAVVEGAYSGVQYLIRAEEARTGRYHALYYGLSEEELASASAQTEITESAVWREVGWVEIGSQNEYKPYLVIKSMGEGFTDLVSVRLEAGRMPENENEILIPKHLLSNGGVSLKLGEELVLSVGERVSEGFALGTHIPFAPEVPEELANAQEKHYTVVGFYGRFDMDIETYNCPGYTALTVGNAEGVADCFFRIKQPSRFYDFLGRSTTEADCREHRELLMCYGSLRDNGLVQLLYGFAAILMFLISFGSISLIYNSFSISISDRTKQFGILKSVGATRKQIRFTVFYEALLLSAVAIPVGMLVGCAGIGITLWALKDAFGLLVGSALDVNIALVISPLGLVIASLSCLITTLISAWVPARKAIALTAIEAIRQSNDVKLRRRDVRASWLTRKLFGFEGMLAAKNFGRNRKQYRATVISLFLSVVLFISVGSFCAYTTDTVIGISASGGDSGAGILYYAEGDADELLALLQVEGVNQSACVQMQNAYLTFALESITDEYVAGINMAELIDETELSRGTYICFVDDASFASLCKENRLDPALFMDYDTPMGIALNNLSGYYVVPGSERVRWRTVNMLTNANLPIVCREETELEKIDYTIGAVIENRAFFLPDMSQFAIVYPQSMLGHVAPAKAELESRILFDVDAHAAVYDRMVQVLSENGYSSEELYDLAEEHEQSRMLVTIVDVFSYGFIILISLIAMANVFNTISTSIALRRREFAMLKSVGLTSKGFNRMMNYECLIYGIRSLLLGLPAAMALSYAIYKVSSISYETSFYVPAYSVMIAVGSVFVVVFATMLYATNRIRKEALLDALKNENM